MTRPTQSANESDRHTRLDVVSDNRAAQRLPGGSQSGPWRAVATRFRRRRDPICWDASTAATSVSTRSAISWSGAATPASRRVLMASTSSIRRAPTARFATGNRCAAPCGYSTATAELGGDGGPVLMLTLEPVLSVRAGTSTSGAIVRAAATPGGQPAAAGLGAVTLADGACAVGIAAAAGSRSASALAAGTGHERRPRSWARRFAGHASALLRAANSNLRRDARWGLRCRTGVGATRVALSRTAPERLKQVAQASEIEGKRRAAGREPG